MKIEKKVLCHFCHQPIHIDHWGGVANFNKVEMWYCDNIVCIVQFSEMLGDFEKKEETPKL